MRRVSIAAFGLIIALIAALCVRTWIITERASEASAELGRRTAPGALAMGDVERWSRAAMNVLTDFWMDGAPSQREELERLLRELRVVAFTHARPDVHPPIGGREESAALAAAIERFASMVAEAADRGASVEDVATLRELRTDELRAALADVTSRAATRRRALLAELDASQGRIRAMLVSKAREIVVFGAGVVAVATLLAGAVVVLIDRRRKETVEAAAELRRALAAARTSALTKSAFLANMSHEIRTPMTAILGFADLLQDESIPSADRRAHVATIRRNGEHLLEVINDILDISRIEAGRMEIRRTRCSPCEIVSEVVALMRVRSEDKGLSLGVEYLFPAPEAVLSDPMRLRQVLMNLVGNAIKFTDEGGVRIVVRCASDMDPPRMTFEVIDTGVGMTPEQMLRLFQPFSQVDASATRRFGGTGLGLAISQHIAHMLGGDITVHSAPGRGSTFTLAVETGSLADTRMINEPCCALATCSGNSVSEESERAAAEGGVEDEAIIAGRILLAEDGADNQRLVAHLLRRAGAEVDIAPNGKVALEMVRDGGKYDLILMDMQMPELDGYGATEALRKDGYRGPIVALTAHAMTGDRDRCMKAGCDDYATKPIRRAELIETVRRNMKSGLAQATIES